VSYGQVDALEITGVSMSMYLVAWIHLPMFLGRRQKCSLWMFDGLKSPKDVIRRIALLLLIDGPLVLTQCIRLESSLSLTRSSSHLLCQSLCSDVCTKYQEAAKIVNLALQGLVQQCVPGAKVIDLCEFGHSILNASAAKLYTKKSNGAVMDRGVAFPVCISVNDVVCNDSPLLSEERVRHSRRRRGVAQVVCIAAAGLDGAASLPLREEPVQVTNKCAMTVCCVEQRTRTGQQTGNTTGRRTLGVMYWRLHLCNGDPAASWPFLRLGDFSHPTHFTSRPSVCMVA
jgi:hypothetical protein